jgi:hypothetical protein
MRFIVAFLARFSTRNAEAFRLDLQPAAGRARRSGSPMFPALQHHGVPRERFILLVCYWAGGAFGRSLGGLGRPSGPGRGIARDMFLRRHPAFHPDAEPGDGRVCRSAANMSAPGAVAAHCIGIRGSGVFGPCRRTATLSNGDNSLAKSNLYLAG